MSDSENSSWRPALIIGLGGSGTKTLRYFNWLAKNSGDVELQNLIETKRILFQAFDTDDGSNATEEVIDPSIVGGGGTMASSAYAVSHELETLDEAFQLERDSIPETLSTLANEDVRELFPDYDSTDNDFEESHIREWFPNYLDNPEDAITAQQAQGGAANQHRPLGRIALFKNFEGIYDLIKGRLVELSACTPPNQKMQIHLVSSLSGGTGAGMFWDIAFLIHTAMKGLHRGFDLQGSFFLPGPFQLNPKDFRTESNAYASLMELASLKNVRRKKPFVVRYPTGERNLTFEAIPRETIIFSSVFIYDAIPPCAIVRDAKASLQESGFCRLAENLLARNRSDIGRLIQVGRDNIATDSNSSLQEVESTYVFSTSSTLALDDLGNTELKDGLLRYCLNSFDEKLDLLLMERHESLDHSLKNIGFDVAKKLGFLLETNNSSINNISTKSISVCLLQQYVAPRNKDAVPGLLKPLLTQMDNVLKQAKKLEFKAFKRHEIHDEMKKLFKQLPSLIAQGWTEQIKAYPRPESINLSEQEEDAPVISELGLLRDLGGLHLSAQEKPSLKKRWLNLSLLFKEVDKKLKESSMALNQSDPLLIFCEQLQTFLKGVTQYKNKEIKLCLQAPVEFHQLRYELGIIADWEKESKPYKAFLRYPPALDHDLREVFQRLLSNIKDGVVSAFGQAVAGLGGDEGDLEISSSQQQLTYHLISEDFAIKLHKEIDDFVKNNEQRAKLITNRRRDLNFYLDDVDILSDEKEEQIANILEPLYVMLTTQMSTKNGKSRKDIGLAEKMRKHHAQNLADYISQQINKIDGDIAETIKEITKKGNDDTENNDSSNKTGLIAEQQMEDLLKQMSKDAEGRDNKQLNKIDKQQRGAPLKTYANDILKIIGLFNDSKNLVLTSANLNKPKPFESTLTLLELVCEYFSSYWMEQKFYVSERFGGKSGLRKKLLSVKSEVFTKGMATRSIQTENLVISLPRKKSVANAKDHEEAKKAIEQLLKLTAERVLGLSPQFVTSHAKHAMIYYEEAFRPGKQIRGVRSYYDAYHQLNMAKKRNAHFYYDNDEPFPDIVPKRHFRNITSGHKKDCFYCTPVNKKKHFTKSPITNVKNVVEHCSNCHNTMELYNEYLSDKGDNDAGYCRNLYECEAGYRVWNTFSDTTLDHCHCCPSTEKSILLNRVSLEANVKACPVCLEIVGVLDSNGEAVNQLKTKDEIIEHFFKDNRYQNMKNNYCCPSCATRPVDVLYGLTESPIRTKGEGSEGQEIGHSKTIHDFLKDTLSVKFEIDTDDKLVNIKDLLEVIQVIATTHESQSAFASLHKSLSDNKSFVSGERLMDINFSRLKKALGYLIQSKTFSGAAFFRRFEAINELAEQAREQYRDGSECAVSKDD